MVPSAISFLFFLLRISLCASPCRAPADVDSLPGDQPGCGGYPEEEGEGSIDNRVRHRRLHPLQLALQGVDLGGDFCFGFVCICIASCFFFLSPFSPVFLLCVSCFKWRKVERDVNRGRFPPLRCPPPTR